MSELYDGAMPELRPQEIHVWRLSLRPAGGCAGQVPECGSDWLDAGERARAERYSRPSARHAFRLTRLQLRWLLGRYLGIAPDSVRFTGNAHGKPRLAATAEDAGLVFNVSHSGRLALLAFGWDTPLGVDVEGVQPRRDLARLAEHTLSASERERWRSDAPDAQLRQFTRYWTAKESLMKATGRGLALGLKQVTVAGGFTGFLAVPAPHGPASAWRLHDWLADGYQCALVHRRPDRTILFFPDDTTPLTNPP